MHDARFVHVYIHIVGPLTPSHRHNHPLSWIGRYSRWPGVIAVRTVTVKSLARHSVARTIVPPPSLMTEDKKPSLIYFFLISFSHLIFFIDETTFAKVVAANRGLPSDKV